MLISCAIRAVIGSRDALLSVGTLYIFGTDEAMYLRNFTAKLPRGMVVYNFGTPPFWFQPKVDTSDLGHTVDWLLQVVANWWQIILKWIWSGSSKPMLTFKILKSLNISQMREDMYV